MQGKRTAGASGAYIITTHHHSGNPHSLARQADSLMRTRRAVATLHEARDAVAESALASVPFVDICAAITLDGGSVGPLADGTVVDVERIEWIELARRVGLDCGDLCAVPNAEIVVAFNALGEGRA